MVLNILPPFALEVVFSIVKRSWTNSGSSAESVGSAGAQSAYILSPSEAEKKTTDIEQLYFDVVLIGICFIFPGGFCLRLVLASLGTSLHPCLSQAPPCSWKAHLISHLTLGFLLALV